MPLLHLISAVRLSAAPGVRRGRVRWSRENLPDGGDGSWASPRWTAEAAVTTEADWLTHTSTAEHCRPPREVVQSAKVLIDGLQAANLLTWWSILLRLNLFPCRLLAFSGDLLFFHHFVLKRCGVITPAADLASLMKEVACRLDVRVRFFPQVRCPSKGGAVMPGSLRLSISDLRGQHGVDAF
jgi:hypothetical protein